MAQKRFRVIAKVLCEDCESKRIMGKMFDVKCMNCKYKKWRNVTNLITFTRLLHSDHPNWVWFNVYDYIQGKPGPKVASFQKNKNEPISKTI